MKERIEKLTSFARGERMKERIEKLTSDEIIKFFTDGRLPERFDNSEYSKSKKIIDAFTDNNARRELISDEETNNRYRS